MISIIISSASLELLEQAKTNIKQTIGVPYELLAYSNAAAKEGICEIYNQGAREAQFDILCYMHEDIDIKTIDWGKKVLELFSACADIGIIGVAGSAYKSYAPSGWDSDTPDHELIYSNYIQSFKKSREQSIRYRSNPTCADLAQVVCTDGMWFCTRRNVVLENPFDEQLLTGFHGYDIDFCLSLYGKYQVVVTFDILMEHFSEGVFDLNWLKDIIKVHAKWSSKLPLAASNISPSTRMRIEKTSYKKLLEKLAQLHRPFSFSVAFLFDAANKRRISILLYLKLMYYAIKYNNQSHVG